jgi:nitroreductase
MSDLLASLRWRYAVKKYDAQSLLSTEDVALLQEVVRLSPSSFGLQPYRVLFIADASVRARLHEASFYQPQITEAPCLVVFAVETTIDESFVRRHFDLRERASRMLPSHDLTMQRDSVIRSIQRMSKQTKHAWATHQAYLALGFLLFAAAQLRIDASPMEGFMPARYDQILGLPQLGLSSVVIAALGYRSSEDRFRHFEKFRRPSEELFVVPAASSQSHRSAS